MWEQGLPDSACLRFSVVHCAYACYVFDGGQPQRAVRAYRSAPGLSFRVVFVHTLRNAMFPVTMIGLTFAMFCGARYRDALNFNGMGYLYYQATGRFRSSWAVPSSPATVIGALLVDSQRPGRSPHLRLAGRSK